MSEVARSLLIKLLAQVDRGGRETLPINERSAKEYFALEGLSGRDSVHAYLANAEKAGGLLLDWGKGAEAQDLKRLRIADANKLAGWLGIPRAIIYAERIEKILAPLMSDFPEWLQRAYDEAMSLWSLGKTAFRIQAEDKASAINLFRIALSVSAGEQNDLDLRRFSVRLLNDSKAVEGMLSKLAPLLRRNPEWKQFENNNELFRVLGLEKFPPPIYIKGPLTISYSGVQWDISQLSPFVGISPDRVFDISLTRKVPYVLTIENLASFQRHVREIEDEGVVIYSAGFPSPALTHILQWIDKSVSDDCQCFHWGDRDIGGIRIFSHIESVFSKHAIHPHLMMVGQSNDRKFNEKERRLLENYAGKKCAAGSMAEYWLDNDLSPMEQEMLDPKTPDIRKNRINSDTQ